MIIAATDTFMSAAPRPNRSPSRSVGVNGSLVHRSTGPGGTTSTCPARQTSGAPVPRRAQRLRTAPRSIRSHVNPAAASRAPSSSRQPASSGVSERQAMSCFARSSVCRWMSAVETVRALTMRGQARSSSLIEVFARVASSTRLTITAQASEYLPSADGRLPGTTTEPDGTRP